MFFFLRGGEGGEGSVHCSPVWAIAFSHLSFSLFMGHFFGEGEKEVYADCTLLVSLGN